MSAHEPEQHVRVTLSCPRSAQQVDGELRSYNVRSLQSRTSSILCCEMTNTLLFAKNSHMGMSLMHVVHDRLPARRRSLSPRKQEEEEAISRLIVSFALVSFVGRFSSFYRLYVQRTCSFVRMRGLRGRAIADTLTFSNFNPRPKLFSSNEDVKERKKI